MNNVKNFSGIICVIIFSILIIFFIGEQRIESKNNELLLKRIENEIKELEEIKQQLILEYNREYQYFTQKKINSPAKPISINDIKIIELKGRSEVLKDAEEKEKTSSDFEKIIKFIKNKLG